MKYYHVWFQTKYKKYLLIDMIDPRIHELLRGIAVEKGIELLASGSLPDHMHLLVGLKEDQVLSWAVKQLKAISARKIFQEVKLLKQDLRINNFWARRYGYKEIRPERIQIATDYVLNQKKDLYLL
ncbi:MAG: IS200/IS605 family transposase [Candidatus Saganbacteria bacterium]|nr:IS200/IS605 family transposase [Candidatus Saganbacteria bacterium]